MRKKQKQRIVFSNGYWRYHDPSRNLVIKLDPVFAKCGWSVNQLCEFLGVEYRTFARLVEESLGITCKIWLRQLRAVAACHLLREGSDIKSVADRLGFRHNSDFTNEFKKLVGVSPSIFLKSEQSHSIGFQPMNPHR